MTNRKKTLYRVLVYGGLALTLGALLAYIAHLQKPIEMRGDLAWGTTDFAALPEVDLLRRYIRVDTSQETGSELAGAEFLAAELRSMGLEPHIEIMGKKANLWAVLEGESREALVLHNHIDVTGGGNPEEWDFPPFGAEIDRFWLYGRGAFDMKSVTVAQLEALKEVAARPEKPKRSIVFLATGSEEVGSELGTRWILEQYPDLVERFWAVLTEGGVLEPKSMEEIKYWGIEFAQKRFIEGSFCAASRERLEELAFAIRRQQEWSHRPVLVPEVKIFLERYSRSRDNPHFNKLLEESLLVLADPTQFATLPAYLQALFRNEIHIFPVEEAPGGGFRMRFFLHLLPGAEPREVEARLLPPWLVHGTTMSLRPVLGSERGSPLDHPVFRQLVAAVEAGHPGNLVGPFFLCFSATDARFFRQAGIPAYGFSPFVIFNTDTFRKDTVNERIGLPGFVTGVDLYAEAVRRIVL